jgi:hypothetical protein
MPKTIKSKRQPSKKSTNVRKSAANVRKPRKGLVHHSKRLYRLTPKFVHGMVVGALVGVVLLSPLGFGRGAEALTISAGKDCDSYSIIKCGITSTNNLKNDYNSSAYVRHVFSHSGISSAEISKLGSTAVKGTVYRNGEVKVNGKVVATKSYTSARLRVTSGDKKVVVNGSTFYTRLLSTSWSHSSAPAYVVMKDGVFQFAVLAPCGNPVTATPVKPPKPTPPPQAPAPKPSLVCNSLSYNNSRLAYTFVAKAAAKNTKITRYSFYFSDRKTPVVVKTSAGRVSIQHTFAKYNTKYSAYVIVQAGNLTTKKIAVCTKKFQTGGPTQCKPGIPAGSPECNKCSDKNGNDICVTPPPTKHPIVLASSIKTLPNTGPGVILFIFIMSMVGGTFFHLAHRFVRQRRHARRHATAH